MDEREKNEMRCTLSGRLKEAAFSLDGTLRSPRARILNAMQNCLVSLQVSVFDISNRLSVLIANRFTSFNKHRKFECDEMLLEGNDTYFVLLRLGLSNNVNINLEHRGRNLTGLEPVKTQYQRYC